LNGSGHFPISHKHKSKPDEFSKKSEYDFNDFEVLRAVRLFFGNWNNALNAAGIHGKKESERGDINLQKPPTKSRLLEIVKGLAESGEDMSPENIIIMHNYIWRWACGKNGYFSHWPTVIRNAGVDLNSLSSERYWSEGRLKNKILDIYESQLILNTHHIRDNFWHLYRFGLRLYGSWPGAVDATGLGYEIVNQEQKNTQLRQEQFQQNLFKILKLSNRSIRWLDTKENGVQRTLGPLGIFGMDESSGSFIGTVLRSWWPGLEANISAITNAAPSRSFELYYLQGEPRRWHDDRVQFVAAADLVEPSIEAGADKYMREILSLQYNVPSFL
jgi:hypothetical protein